MKNNINVFNPGRVFLVVLSMVLLIASMAVLFSLASCTQETPHEHTFSEEWSKDETYHWHAATCEHTEEYSDKAEHTWDEGKITNPGSCTEPGTMLFTCTVCGATKTESVPELGHSWDEGEVTTQPTCTTAGVKTFTCSACKTTRTEEIPAAHKWNEGEVTTEPAFMKNGEITYTCTECDETKTEVIERGDGTKDNPYLITSEADWNAFVDATVGTTAANAFSGKYFKLTDDISVSRMASSYVGESSFTAFRGKFDGDGHTITLTLDSSEFAGGTQAYNTGLALFMTASNGCEIRNLHVTGTITTDRKYAAGFITYVNGASGTNPNFAVVIENCRSSVKIISSVTGDATSAGFVAIGRYRLNLTLKNCLFDGSFVSESGENFSGLVGYQHNNISNYSQLTISDCAVIPGDETSERLKTETGSMTFLRGDNTLVPVFEGTVLYASVLGNQDAGKAASKAYLSQTDAAAAPDVACGTVKTATIAGQPLYYVADVSHTYDAVVTKPSTCEEEGILTYTCSVCGDSYEETFGPHTINEEHMCTVCGEFVPFVGPAGGYVFYNCDMDNNEENDGAGPDGLRSDVCGWKYLEMAPGRLIHNSGNPCMSSTSYSIYPFGYYRLNDDEPNLFVNGTTTYDPADCTGTAVGTGAANTELLVSTFGETTYSTKTGSDKTYYAALDCYLATHTAADGTVYDDWFMPSIDELALIHQNIYLKGLVDMKAWDHLYLASSEKPNNPNANQEYRFLKDGTGHPTGGEARSTTRPVIAIRAYHENHNIVHVDASAATCAHAQIAEHYACTICGKLFSDAEGLHQIPESSLLSGEPLAHTWDSGEDLIVATCTKEGVKRYTCTECGKTKTEIQPMTEHPVDAEHKCTVCGAFIPFTGPAGGYVFYDCDYDNSAENDGAGPDGLKSDVCGWRFLEAAPAQLRVVGGSPTVDSSAEGYAEAATSYIFGYYRPDGNSYKYISGESTYNAETCTGKAIGTGKTNTERLVAGMGAEAYTKSSGDEKTPYYATGLCASLVLENKAGTFDDWFLPSVEEARLLKAFLCEIGSEYKTGDYATSSEYENTPGHIYAVQGTSSAVMTQRNYNKQVYPIRCYKPEK